MPEWLVSTAWESPTQRVLSSMSVYLENIERNRAAYRAALSRRASLLTRKQPMQSFLFEDLDERGKKAAIFRYWSEVPADWDIEVFFKVAKWRFTEHGERIA